METTISSEKYGDFEVSAYRQTTTGDVHLAIYKGELRPDEPTMVRVHSNTETGDILGILFDGYAMKLNTSLEMIAEAGKGVLLYMRHGEKGDSIIDKLRSIDKDPDNNPVTIEEQRDFGVGAQILRDLNVGKMTLLSSHDRRRIGLIGYGLEIVNQIQIQ